MSKVSAPLNPNQIDLVRRHLDRVNELLPYSKGKKVEWTDEQLSSRISVFERIQDIGDGCPEKAAVEYANLLIGLQVQDLLKTAKTSGSVH